MEAPGNMVLVEGDDRAKAWLHGAEPRVNDWLYELVDELVFHARERLQIHAPGGIDQLIDVRTAHETVTGAFEGIAGVEPDITEETFHAGLGSNPADYPVFVEVGTGIFGPVGEAISTIPGHLMGPIVDPHTGRSFFTQIVQGQRPQHYAEHAFEDTVEVTEVRIRAHLPELGRRE